MLYSPSQVNLHTHSFYCRHGKGTIDEFVQQAKADGLKLLGFSEHCPLPDREYQKGNRMDYEELPAYEADVRSYMGDPDLKVLLGAECDWLPGEESFYRDELLGNRGYDYLICSVHHMADPSDGKEKFLQYLTWMPVGLIIDYVDLYTAALDSGMFLFGCHPDLFLAGHRKWDAEAKAASRDIIQCALDTACARNPCRPTTACASPTRYVSSGRWRATWASPLSPIPMPTAPSTSASTVPGPSTSRRSSESGFQAGKSRATPSDLPEAMHDSSRLAFR